MYTLLGQVLNARGAVRPFMWPLSSTTSSRSSAVDLPARLRPGAARGPQHRDPPADRRGRRVLVHGAGHRPSVLSPPSVSSGRRSSSSCRSGDPASGTVRASGSGAPGWARSAASACGPSRRSCSTSRRARHREHHLGGAAGSICGHRRRRGGRPGAYSQALMIYLLPHSLITVSIATALFTGMSAAADGGDVAKCARSSPGHAGHRRVHGSSRRQCSSCCHGPIVKIIVPTLNADSLSAVGTSSRRCPSDSRRSARWSS